MSKVANKKRAAIPWTNVLGKSSWHTSYIDYIDNSNKKEVKRYIFIPYEDNGLGISMCINNAYNLAMLLMKTEKWDGFHVLIKVGDNIGQEINRLYIELIPVKSKT